MITGWLPLGGCGVVGLHCSAHLAGVVNGKPVKNSKFHAIVRVPAVSSLERHPTDEHRGMCRHHTTHRP